MSSRKWNSPYAPERRYDGPIEPVRSPGYPVIKARQFQRDADGHPIVDPQRPAEGR